jgi:hypothetical protein
VLFDLDDVITTPKKHYNVSYKERKKIVKEMEKKYGENEAKKFWSIILQNRKIEYIDDKIPGIFNYIKQNKIPTMALTKCFTNKYGIIEHAEDWRIKELEDLKLNFHDISPLKGEVAFDDIVPINGRPSSITMLKKGVIFTGRADKGMILERVFQHYNYFPKEIIFIDDKFKNLVSIENLAKKYNIKFKGIVITKSEKLPQPSLESSIEKKRFEILENQGKWVIDLES